MSFNANTSPKDVNGCPITAGVYRVERDGQGVQIGWVTEADDTTLWVVFAGNPRPQRVDELSQFCKWTQAEQSEIDEANGVSRGA